MNGLPKLKWRWLASFSFAIIAMVLAVHVKAQDSTIDPIAIQDNTTIDFVAPAVFQAAGPNIASIQGTVTDFRNALGAQVNNNVLNEVGSGHRPIQYKPWHRRHLGSVGMGQKPSRCGQGEARRVRHAPGRNRPPSQGRRFGPQAGRHRLL